MTANILAAVSAVQAWRAKQRIKTVEKVAVALDSRVAITEKACFYPACGHIDGTSEEKK